VRQRCDTLQRALGSEFLLFSFLTHLFCEQSFTLLWIALPGDAFRILSYLLPRVKKQQFSLQIVRAFLDRIGLLS
jgi:hypothetical protein